jgi:osmotically-inducible protein OsmY
MNFGSMTFFKITALLIATICLNACTTLVDITTSEPIKPDPTKRTIGTYIDDEQLETIARVNLRKTSDALKQSNIQVSAFNGVVLLTGQVANKSLRTQAAEVISELDRVRQVHNELEVRDNATFWINTNDQWISTKVKTKLLANKDIKSSRVKVKTENGIVYLMGLLSRAQAEKVTNVVAGTSRVVKVVRVFEYVD